MPEPQSMGSTRAPKSIPLALPAVYQGSGSYTESPRGFRDVQYVKPGSKQKPGESSFTLQYNGSNAVAADSGAAKATQFNSANIAQPFLDPSVFKMWQTKS
ncbi:hypothetical protein C8034_v010812 [Colletotrichum sidae]|uniref:Uncharacterized protein n=2 Tax=Colletotrichum orbiculare species complex TaxID=2707354 RepID=A0A4R8QTX0_9PEZI|nr:hypothetical protein C8035_v003658 [Colletotrichum spinosum]TEA18886.1 hypothetical protein C8034_v010812 [Colletotrichum sidae]